MPVCGYCGDDIEAGEEEATREVQRSPHSVEVVALCSEECVEAFDATDDEDAGETDENDDEEEDEEGNKSSTTGATPPDSETPDTSTPDEDRPDSNNGGIS